MKLTKIQWVTLVALLAYLIYELFLVPRWKANHSPDAPILRIDLVFILPALVTLIGISIFHFVRHKSD